MLTRVVFSDLESMAALLDTYHLGLFLKASAKPQIGKYVIVESLQCFYYGIASVCMECVKRIRGAWHGTIFSLTNMYKHRYR